MAIDFNLFSLFIVVFIAICARYLLLSAGLHWYFWKRQPAAYFDRLSRRAPTAQRIRREVRWSLASSLVFTMVFIATYQLYQLGYTKIYLDFSDHSLAYAGISAVLVLIFQDLHFYLFHRLLHHPFFYRFHKIHHISQEPTAWTAFCFHPLEALLSASFLPIVAVTIPLHPSTVVFLFSVMTIFAVTNHLGWEVFPTSWLEGRIGRWLITAKHHQNHHQKFTGNYGLYFRFLDRVLGTDIGLCSSKASALRSVAS